MHATVFSELGAVISNMVRFGCPEDDIRAFLDHMCARSQLTDEQVGLPVKSILVMSIHGPLLALEST